jgi:CubicO group peptidase (beta-lactamase class C family)
MADAVNISQAGLSAERLGRLDSVMAGYVERGEIPGIIALVSRRGETYISINGSLALDGPEPMRRDTIFRVASLSKPIVAVAAMILVEECRLRLDDPIDPFLPELADRTVLKRLDGPLSETERAERPLSLRDLLTMRMGFGFVMSPNGDWPIEKAMQELEIATGPNPVAVSPEEWLQRLGSVPLLHQPGTAWMYDTAFDVLGVLIARVTGQSLGAFLQERIFEPLGMKDTGFSVPAEKLDRLATCYQSGEGGKTVVWDAAQGGKWSTPPVFESARGGLASTADDYLAFGQMMLNKGKHGSQRILSRLSVEAMTTNQITRAQLGDSEFIIGPDRGWGLGLAVMTQRGSISSVPGQFGWDGGYGTSWAADPTEELNGILLTQRMWDSADGPNVYRDFWTLAYQAIDD